MSKVICIMGESGSGKTTAMRNLPPEETVYVDCDKKGLSWKGWRNEFNVENKNYMASDDADKIMRMLVKISDKRPEIKYVVIDTINGIMVGDEMRRCKEKGYDKWMDLAQCIWNMVDTAPTLRDDLNIIFTAHTQTERDDSGYMFTRIKTSGKKIDKICLESKFTTILNTKAPGRRLYSRLMPKTAQQKLTYGEHLEEGDEIDSPTLLWKLSKYWRILMEERRRYLYYYTISNVDVK